MLTFVILVSTFSNASAAGDEVWIAGAGIDRLHRETVDEGGQAEN